MSSLLGLKLSESCILKDDNNFSKSNELENEDDNLKLITSFPIKNNSFFVHFNFLKNMNTLWNDIFMR